MMFRKIAVLVAAALLVASASAARRLTAGQLEEALAASRNKSDQELAWQIAGLEMGERISAARLARLEAEVPGEQSRRALVALADESQFLDLPTAEIPPTAAPTPEQQRQMMAQILAYVADAIPKLPNFFATRETLRFVDTPSQYDVRGNVAVRYQPLHAAGETSRTVTYRDGKEVADESPSQVTTSQGLQSWGEFGPILSTVILDAARGKVTWSHWEQGPNGPVAVYRYSVQKDVSHYEVDYCCLSDSENTHLRDFKKTVGYHGEIAADPATGAITRLVLESELKSGDQVSLADILVEYAPVEIGGRSYICPVRSLALSKAQMSLNERRFQQLGATQGKLGEIPANAEGALQTGALSEGPQQTLLNDVKFTDYHVFRSETQIMASSGTEAVPSAEAAASAMPAPVTTSGPSVAADASTTPAPVAAPSTTPTDIVATPAPPPEPPEFSVTPATGFPNAPASANPDASGTGLTLHTTARLVDVDVVVYDRKGHPITDLKQSDFQIYDGGRLQTVRSFSQAALAAAVSDPPGTPTAPASAAAETQPVFTNVVPTPESQTTQPSTILLIDATSLAFEDLSWAREEMLRFLKSATAQEPVGLYILRARGLEVLTEPTADHTQVAALLTQWKPSMQDLGNAQEAEQRNRQQIDEVHKVGDLYRVNGNTDAEDPDGGTDPMDPQLRDFGSNPAGNSLIGLTGVARHLAPMPGHKSLVWVSSDNVLADWTNTTGGNPTIQTAVERYALRAQEAMNEAHVSVYPLDASQLEGGAITADMQHRNVELNPAAKDAAGLGAGSSTHGMGAASGEDVSVNRDARSGRTKAEMQADLHAIQPEIQQLAIATGGRALRRASDLTGELNGIVEDGHAVYMLGFTPDTQPDNQYHDLMVKVAGRRDVSMRYRKAYLYAIEPATLRDHFQQALWQATDATDLTITATPRAGKDGPELRLNVAGTGLDLAQKGDRYVDQLDFYFVQRDESGGHARVAGQNLHLDLKAETYQEVVRDGVPFKQTLTLRPNLGSLRVLVVDENSGRIGSVTIPASGLE